MTKTRAIFCRSIRISRIPLKITFVAVCRVTRRFQGNNNMPERSTRPGEAQKLGRILLSHIVMKKHCFPA